MFTPNDSGILYDICAAVDSVIFESRSTYEMTGNFVTRFCEVILNRRVTQEDVIRVLTDAGQDVAWIQALRDSRVLFFHNTAPWIALEIHARDPLQFQVLQHHRNLGFSQVLGSETTRVLFGAECQHLQLAALYVFMTLALAMIARFQFLVGEAEE